MKIFEERQSKLELDVENNTCWGKYRINSAEENDEGMPVFELWDNKDNIVLSIATETFIHSKDFLCIPLKDEFTFYYKDLDHYYKIPYDSQFKGDGFSALVDFNGRWLSVCTSPKSNVEVYELDRKNLKFKKLMLSMSIDRMNLMSNPQHEHPICSSGMILSRGNVDEFFSWEDLLGNKKCKGKPLQNGVNVAFFDPEIYVAQCEVRGKTRFFAYDLKTMEKLWEKENKSCWYFGSQFLTDDDHVYNPKDFNKIFTASDSIVAITKNDDSTGYIVWTE